jgi:RNA-directed DNA polymerase
LLENAQKQIASAIADSVVFDDCVQGFVKGRSIATNAKAHIGADVVLRADIRDFFESISIAPIQSAFESLGAASEAAALLAEIVSLEGILVQGASSSPAVANLVVVDMDRDLRKLANEFGSKYTRYSDDLTFSGSRCPGRSDLEAVLERHGFVMAKEKCRYQYRGKSQFVTGLSVADSLQPRVPKRTKRWLRAAVHAAGRYGIDELVKHIEIDWHQNAEIARIDGTIAYMYSVEPKVAAALDRIWQPALREADRGFDLRRPTLYM